MEKLFGAQPLYTKDFEAFWKEFPYKYGKDDAFRQWRYLMPDPKLKAEIMAGLETWKQSERWQKSGGMFIPKPSNWLKDRAWEAFLDMAGVTPPPLPPRCQRCKTGHNWSRHLSLDGKTRLCNNCYDRECVEEEMAHDMKEDRYDR